MRYHIIYSVFCMMLYAARGSGQLIGEIIDNSKLGDSPVDCSGEYTRKTVDSKEADIFRDSKWKVHSSRTLFSVSSSSSGTGNKKNPSKQSIRNNPSIMSTNTSSKYFPPKSSNRSYIHNGPSRNMKNGLDDDLFEDGTENLGKRKAKRAEVYERNERAETNKQRNDLKRNVVERRDGADVSRRNIEGNDFSGVLAPGSSYVLDNRGPGRSLNFHGNGKRGFQLVPLPRNVYVLKEDIPSPGEQPLLSDYSSRHSIVAPGHSGSSFRTVGHYSPRLSGDRTSAMLSFKAHMHHDVKNIGSNFRRKISDRNIRFVNPANSPRGSVESSNEDSESSGSSSFGSPDFLAVDSPNYAQAPNNQNSVDPSSDSSSNDDLGDGDNVPTYGRSDLTNDLDPSMGSASFFDASSSLKNGNPNAPLFVNNFEENQLPYEKWDFAEGGNPIDREFDNDPSIYQAPLGEDKFSWVENSRYNEPREVFNNVGRDARQSNDDRTTRKYSLKYLDRYAKALSSMDESYSNNLEEISSQVEDRNNGDGEDFLGQRGLADSVNVDDPSAQPQESLDDIEKQFSPQNDNSLKIRDISSLDDDPALSPTDLMSDLSADDLASSPDLASFDQQDNAINANQAKIKERSFSNVIAPLTAQLQDLLSTIKSVNRNLRKESQKKRDLTSFEKTRRKRHHEVPKANPNEQQIDENDSQAIERLDHEQKRFIDYSEGAIKQQVEGSKRQKKHSSSSEDSESQAIEDTQPEIPINASLTNTTQGTKQKRNPGIIDFLEKAFGMKTHEDQSVTEATVTVFDTSETEFDGTGRYFETKEYPPSSEESIDLKSVTETVPTVGTTTKPEFQETTMKNVFESITNMTTAPAEKQKEKISPTSIATPSSRKTELPAAGATRRLTEQPNESNEKTRATGSPKPKIEPATNRQSISSEIAQARSSSFSAIKIKPTMPAIVDVPTTPGSLLGAHGNVSIVASPREHYQAKSSSGNNSSNVVAEAQINALSNLSSTTTNLSEASNPSTQTSPSTPLANPLKLQDTVPKPSHKLGEQRIAIDFSEVKRARESGVQDFLVKLISPEVVRNITNDGVVVRIPSAKGSSASLSLGNNNTHSQPAVNASEQEAEINDQKVEKVTTIRSHSPTPEIETDEICESPNKTMSLSPETNPPDGRNLSRPFTAGNNDRTSSHTETTKPHSRTSSAPHYSSPKCKNKPKVKSIGDTIVAISEDDTSGNARVDITLKIPAQKSQSRQEIVSHDSKDENSTRSERNENASKIFVVNQSKRSAYDAYDDAEDYDEYLENYDPDISNDYDLENPDSALDTEKIDANLDFDAAETQDIYEDDYEPAKLPDDRVKESPLEVELDAIANESSKKKNDLKPVHPYIWPEHIDDVSRAEVDFTDFSKNPSTPLYKLPKRFQESRKPQKNRGTNKQSGIQSNRKKKNVASNKKKSKRTATSNSKKPSPVRLGRKLQSISEFECNRKLFGLDEFDDDVSELFPTKAIDEFQIENDPLTLDLPNERIPDVGINPTDFYATFEPEASSLNGKEIDMDLDVTPALGVDPPVLPRPKLPSPSILSDEIDDEAEPFEHDNYSPEAATEASTRSLVCTCAKTPESVDEMMASLLTPDEPILTTAQATEMDFTTEQTEETLFTAKETIETVWSPQETIDLILTFEKENSTRKTTAAIANSKEKDRKKKTGKKTSTSAKGTTKEIGSNEKTTKQTKSKLKSNKNIKRTKSTTAQSTLLENATTAEETTALSQITPTFSTVPTTTIESSEISTTETEETTSIKIETAPKTTESLSPDLLAIDASTTKAPASKSTTKSKSSQSPGSGKSTASRRNSTSQTFSTASSTTKLNGKTRNNKNKSPKKMGPKKNAVTSKKSPKPRAASDDQENVDPTIAMRNATSEESAEPGVRRYRASDDEEQESTMQREIVVEITEETSQNDESTVRNSDRTGTIEGSTVISTILEDYVDDHESIAAPGATIREDSLRVPFRAARKMPGKEIKGEELRVKRTTEMQTKLTKAYFLRTTPLPVVMKDTRHLDEKMANEESTEDFEMSVTLPEILERPDEEPLEGETYEDADEEKKTGKGSRNKEKEKKRKSEKDRMTLMENRKKLIKRLNELKKKEEELNQREEDVLRKKAEVEKKKADREKARKKPLILDKDTMETTESTEESEETTETDETSESLSTETESTEATQTLSSKDKKKGQKKPADKIGKATSTAKPSSSEGKGKTTSSKKTSKKIGKLTNTTEPSTIEGETSTTETLITSEETEETTETETTQTLSSKDKKKGAQKASSKIGKATSTAKPSSTKGKGKATSSKKTSKKIGKVTSTIEGETTESEETPSTSEDLTISTETETTESTTTEEETSTTETVTTAEETEETTLSSKDKKKGPQKASSKIGKATSTAKPWSTKGKGKATSSKKTSKKTGKVTSTIEGETTESEETPSTSEDLTISTETETTESTTTEEETSTTETATTAEETEETTLSSKDKKKGPQKPPSKIGKTTSTAKPSSAKGKATSSKKTSKKTGKVISTTEPTTLEGEATESEETTETEVTESTTTEMEDETSTTETPEETEETTETESEETTQTLSLTSKKKGPQKPSSKPGKSTSTAKPKSTKGKATSSKKTSKKDGKPTSTTELSETEEESTETTETTETLSLTSKKKGPQKPSSKVGKSTSTAKPSSPKGKPKATTSKKTSKKTGKVTSTIEGETTESEETPSTSEDLTISTETETTESTTTEEETSTTETATTAEETEETTLSSKDKKKGPQKPPSKIGKTTSTAKPSSAKGKATSSKKTSKKIGKPASTTEPSDSEEETTESTETTSEDLTISTETQATETLIIDMKNTTSTEESEDTSETFSTETDTTDTTESSDAVDKKKPPKKTSTKAGKPSSKTKSPKIKGKTTPTTETETTDTTESPIATDKKKPPKKTSTKSGKPSRTTKPTKGKGKTPKKIATETLVIDMESTTESTIDLEETSSRVTSKKKVSKKPPGKKQKTTKPSVTLDETSSTEESIDPIVGLTMSHFPIGFEDSMSSVSMDGETEEKVSSIEDEDEEDDESLDDITIEELERELEKLKAEVKEKERQIEIQEQKIRLKEKRLKEELRKLEASDESKKTEHDDEEDEHERKEHKPKHKTDKHDDEEDEEEEDEDAEPVETGKKDEFKKKKGKDDEDEDEEDEHERKEHKPKHKTDKHDDEEDEEEDEEAEPVETGKKDEFKKKKGKDDEDEDEEDEHERKEHKPKHKTDKHDDEEDEEEDEEAESVETGKKDEFKKKKGKDDEDEDEEEDEEEELEDEEDLEMVEDSTMEGASGSTEDWSTTISTSKPWEESSQPTPVPPVEETSAPIHQTTNESKKKKKRKKCKRKKKPKMMKSRAFVFDEDEEVWRKKRPENYARATIESLPAEMYKRAAEGTPVFEEDGHAEKETTKNFYEEQTNSEQVTRKVCPHVLDDEALLVDSQQHPNQITEDKCPRDNPEETKEPGHPGHGRVARKLMDHDDDSPSQKLSKLQAIASDADLSLNKRHGKKKHKQMKLDHLSLQHHEWKNMEITPELRSPVGFTRVYEIRSKNAEDVGILLPDVKETSMTHVKRDEQTNFHKEPKEEEFFYAEGDLESDESLDDEETRKIDDAYDLDYHDETRSNVRERDDRAEVDETEIPNDDDIENQIDEASPEYGDEHEPENNSTNNENPKSQRLISDDEKNLIQLEQEVRREEETVLKKEEDIRKEEEEVSAYEQLLRLDDLPIPSRRSRVGKRKILESDEGTGSRKSGFVDEDRRIRRKNLVRSIPKDNTGEYLGPKKKPFTVNVLRLEYDEDEESHKMISEQPSGQEQVTATSDDLEYQPEDDEAGDENLDEDSEVPCDDSDESNHEDEEQMEAEDPENEQPIVPASGASQKNSKSRNPPGSEWPTERTSKYHTGGTMTWDEEFPTRPKEIKRAKEAIDEEDRRFDDRDEHSNSDVTNDRVKINFKVKRQENQIERPMLTRSYRSRRWRSIETKKRKSLQLGNSSIILKRDVLGRKLSGFEENPARQRLRNLNDETALKSNKNNESFLANVEPKTRSKKSIDFAEAEEKPECLASYDNDNDYIDEKADDYEDDEVTNDYEDDDDDDDFAQDEEDFSSLTENDSRPRANDFDDVYLAPTEGIITSSKGRMIGVTKGARVFSSSVSVKYSKIEHPQNVTDSTSLNATTDIFDLQAFTQQKSSSSPRNLSLGGSQEIHRNLVTEDPLFNENNATSDPTTVQTNSQSEETTETLISTIKPEKSILIIPSDQPNQSANKTSGKHSHPSHYHFSAEYADYEQDTQQDKTNPSISSYPGKSVAAESPKERIANSESVKKMASANAGEEITSIEKNSGVNKTLPIFVKLDDAKLFELKNLAKPPAEIYVIYKCGPPIVVGEYSSTESSVGKKVTIGASHVKATMKELTGRQRVVGKVAESVQRTSSATKEPPEEINLEEKLNPEVESARLEDKELEFVPLCGRYGQDDSDELLISNSGETAIQETSDTFGVPGEVTNGGRATREIQQDNSMPTITETAVSGTSLSSSSSNERVRASKETERQEGIGRKTTEGKKKFFDFSKSRKKQSPATEFSSQNIKKRFVSKDQGTREKKASHKSRTSRSLDSRLHSIENWQAEVNLDKRDTTTLKFREGGKRRNFISSYEDVELENEIPNVSDYEELETVDKTGRSLLGLEPFPESQENKSRNHQERKNRRGKKKINSSGKNRKKSKRRVLRDMNKKHSSSETPAGFRKSPALDSGVLEEDDNPAETSSLLDKVMDMINPKDPSGKLAQENEPIMEGMREPGKEEKPRSLLERVKDIISNAIGLGKKDKIIMSTKTMVSTITTPSTVPDYREKSLLYDAEKMLASLTPPDADEPSEQLQEDSSNEKPSNLHDASKNSSKQAAAAKKKKKNSAAVNKKKKSNKKSKKKSAGNIKLQQQHRITSKNEKSHGKLVFQNRARKVNTSEIIPRIRDLIQKQNLGGVEKIIVYVDKYEDKPDHRTSKNPIKNSHLDPAEKASNTIPQKDISFRLHLKSPKSSKSQDNENLDFSLADHGESRRRDVGESHAKSHDDINLSEQLDSGKFTFDGLPFDTVVSRVADEILKSAESSENGSQNLEPDVSVTVTPRVAVDGDSAEEKMTTEFLLDMFNQESPSPSSSTEKKQKLVSTSKNSMNFRKSSRLTSKVSKKRMNLPDVPRKSQRKNWKEKIKREDEEEKRNRERNLDIIRRRLLRELTRKLAEKRARRFPNKSRIRRSPTRNKHGNSKSKSVPKHRDNLNEKIRIIYSMQRKNSKDKHSQKHGNHFEDSKNRKSRTRNVSSDKSEKNSEKNPTKRHKRNEHLESNDFSGDSEESVRIGEQKRFDFLAIPDGRESSENNTTKETFSKHDMANNDSILYSHMLDMEKELLKKSNSRSASSSLKERNAEYSKCPRISKDVCEGKYERMKKLVHAGVHYLLRRFDDCENCKIENAPLVSNTSMSMIKKKREDDETINVENMAKKIINFASKIDSRNCEEKKARRAEGKVENLIEKFGIDELGLKSEKDKKSLAALINEIVDVQKSVNETLEIMKSRSSEIKKIEAGGSTKNSTTTRNINKKQTKNEKKYGKRNSKKIRSKKKEKDKIEKKFDQGKRIEKNVKKTFPRNVIEKENPTPEDKKKLESRSSQEGHLDELGEEIRAILTEESDQDPKGSTSNDSAETSNTSRKVRHLEMINNDVYPRYARDIDHTNIANFGKYRIRRVRSIVWNPAHLPSEDGEETILQNLPQFLDGTNISRDYYKNKKKNDTSEKTSINSRTPEATTTRVTLTQLISTKRGSTIAKKNESEKFSNRFKNLAKNKKIETKRRNRHEKHHHPRKKREKFMIRMASMSKNEKKLISEKRRSTTSPSLGGASKWKLNGRANLAPATGVNMQLPHFSVQRKLQSSPRISGSRSPKRKAKKSAKRKKVGKRSIKKSSKLSEKKVSRHNEKRESQTVIPMDNGHLRVKYIYRDVTEQISNRTADFLENHDPEVQGIAKETQNFRNEQKAVFASVPVTEHPVKNNNCATCICDIVETIDELKNILTARGDTLMKIKNYECPKYEEIGDEIVLFSSGIIGDILPKSRRDLAEAKGMTYVKPEDLEDVLRGRSDYENNDNDLMSFPGNDIYVPCNRDGDDVTWLTSISKPNYSWTRDDGLPVSGFIRKNGNLELYDVDSKDSANYTCLVSYIDPDNEELVQNEYEHKIQVVTLPRYTLRGGNRYELENCDETVLDVLASHLPRKLNDILCKRSICDAFIYAPRCYHKQISVRALILPSSTTKLFPVGGNQCGLRCKKAVQDKVALTLSKNLRTVLQKPIVFRLPHRAEDKLVPIATELEKNPRNKRGRSDGNGDVDGQVGLLVGCPAGYGLRDSHCYPCSPGSHSDNMGSRCKKCPQGTHQPNAGARTCRSCTYPFVEGCYQMLWNSSSAVMAILVSLSAVITIFMILVWMLCCGKGKKSSATGSCARSTEIELKYQQADRSLRQPLIEPYRDLTEDEERWCDCEKLKKKKKRLLRKKLLSRDGEALEKLAHRAADRQQRTMSPDHRVERVRIVPISCIDSYRSHGGRQSKNNCPKRYDYAKPPLPLPDFPR